MADIELLIKIPEEIRLALINNIKLSLDQQTIFDSYIKHAIINGIPLPKGHGRKFEEIVVEYPPAELCTYPEYKGKPYFSIKYEENGEHIIGFGTYKPEVLSRYLQEYFIAPYNTEKENKNDRQGIDY